MTKQWHKSWITAALGYFLILQGFAADAPQAAILARADLPNSMIPQAEVRLVRRGEEMVVQSAILPRFPNKVRKKILASEQQNWPGSPDAHAYVAALEDAFETYAKEHDRKTTALVIDFVSSADRSRVDFLFAAAVRNQEGITIQTAPVWRSLDLSDDYIRKNQENILVDAFGKNADALIKTLRNTTSRDTPE